MAMAVWAWISSISTAARSSKPIGNKGLNQLRGRLIKQDAYLVVLQEEWPGGAGNGFGTLYAYNEARAAAKELYDIDLIDFQNQGKAVAIYHTAGQGKRLSPLTASERNNKSAVKLPSCLSFAKDSTISILEAVIWQSAPLAHRNSGCLSVFWGDQVFLSKEPLLDHPKHEIEIFARGQPMPNAEEWIAQGLNKYGFLLPHPQERPATSKKLPFKRLRN